MTRLSYNLVKNFNTVVPQEDKVVIDSNEIIAQKLQAVLQVLHFIKALL